MTEEIDPEETTAPVARITPVVLLLILTNVGIFVYQEYFVRAIHSPLAATFALSPAGIRNGEVWQLFTYMFLHGGLLHLILNMFVLFMMGPETERGMGWRQFALMYILSGVLAGVGWLIVSGGDSGTYCVGASGAIFGIIGAFAALYPRREITVLLLFVYEMPMKAMTLALFLGGLEILFLYFQPFGGGVANAAHLGGGVAGYVYVFRMIRMNPTAVGNDRKVAPRERGSAFSLRKSTDKETVEIDRILEKIDKGGMKSLSQAERDLLHRKSSGGRGGK
jgi:membrane associated rhomboid family serine protease